jgi:iron complex transport system substrate-binding protein
VIGANPDLIFLADTTCCAQSASTVTARPGWSALTAARTNGIVTLDPDLAATWGPRVANLLTAITDGAAKAPVG